jgi:two-component system, chemotaxis family, protein-glutamate methylesterase/glutaminase
MMQAVAVAASTGGPQALASVVRNLPTDLGAPVLVVQHIASGFERHLAEWLDDISGLKVSVASAGEPLRPGHLLLAPAGVHLGVTNEQTALLSHAAPLAGFRPSATFLFRSVAAVYGSQSLAVVLTGIGSDGVEGLRHVKKAGGYVLVQDEATCVAVGMPKAALAANLANRVVPLTDVGAAIDAACRRR